MSRQQQHRKRRRVLGLCAREGCQVLSGDRYYCDDHAKDHAQYECRGYRRRQRRRQQQLQVAA